MATRAEDNTLTVNGIVIEYVDNETVLQAALRCGVSIPTLCYDSRLSVPGHCKVCLASIDGKIKPSCIEPAARGMAVETHTPKVVQARQKRVSAILKQHKGNCSTCAQWEFCGLIRLAEEVGLESPRFVSDEPQDDYAIEDKLRINLHKCIKCGKCVRVCAEIRKIGALKHPRFGGDVPQITFTAECEKCGQCAAMCPTGAITEMYRERPQRRVQSTCTYCATGCSIYLDVRDEQVVGVTSDDLDPVGRGNLCVKGRFGFTFAFHQDRLTSPLLKTGDGFREISWEDAFTLTADTLLQIKDKYGPHAIGGIGSARATNEDNYMFQKLLRGALGTNNIDNCARLCHTPAAYALQKSLGISASTTSLLDLEHTDTIVVAGSNTTEAHPIASLHIKWAISRGVKCIVIDPRAINLTKMADMHLQLKPGTNTAMANALLKVIVDEGLFDLPFIESLTEGWDEVVALLSSMELDEMAAITGVEKDSIREAARLITSSRRSIIVSGLGIDEHQYGTEGMFAFINLALATGNIGKPGTGVLCLRGQNNVQGASDMGCLPHVFPGYQSVADEEANRKFSQAWGVTVASWIGKTSTKMLDSALTGHTKALYVWGEDPAQTHGDTLRVMRALEALEFLVYQDMFLTKTARKASIVLPAAAFMEKDGTYTNTERRIRLIRKAVNPSGQAKADWKIFQELANRLGLPSTCATATEVYDEMAALTQYFKGISHKRLGKHGLQWPCTSSSHPGTVRLYANGFPGGRARFHVIPYRQPQELTNEQYPLVLITGRRLYHFNNAAQTKRTQTTQVLHEVLEMNLQDMEELGLKDGDAVKVFSRRGEVELTALSSPILLKGTAFTSFHYEETPINVLVGGFRDTCTDTYSYKYTAIGVSPS